MDRDARRDLQPFARVLRPPVSSLVAVMREGDGADIGENACRKGDLFAPAPRGRSGGGGECPGGRTSVELGQAECVDGAFGHDERRQGPRRFRRRQRTGCGFRRSRPRQISGRQPSSVAHRMPRPASHSGAGSGLSYNWPSCPANSTGGARPGRKHFARRARARVRDPFLRCCAKGCERLRTIQPFHVRPGLRCGNAGWSENRFEPVADTRGQRVLTGGEDVSGV